MIWFDASYPNSQGNPKENEHQKTNCRIRFLAVICLSWNFWGSTQKDSHPPLWPYSEGEMCCFVVPNICWDHPNRWVCSCPIWKKTGARQELFMSILCPTMFTFLLTSTSFQGARVTGPKQVKQKYAKYIFTSPNGDLLFIVCTTHRSGQILVNPNSIIN